MEIGIYNSTIDEKVSKTLSNIRQRRTYLNYSQEYMALKLNISQNAYSKIERGLAQMTLQRLHEIADVLLTTPQKLITKDEMIS